MSRRLLLALCASAALLAAAPAAHAIGALAIGQNDDGYFSFGYGVSYDTAAEARRNALASCNREMRRSGGGDGCRVVTTFRDQCFAFATDRSGRRGLSWSTADSAQAARNAAIRQCRADTGDACRIIQTNEQCDGD